MYNWNTKPDRKNTPSYTIWKLNQMINFGLGKGKLRETEVKKYWKMLTIDPLRKAFLKYIIWHKLS